MNIEQLVNRIEKEMWIVTRVKDLGICSPLNKRPCGIELNSIGTVITVLPNHRSVRVHYNHNEYELFLTTPDTDIVHYVYPDIPAEHMKPDENGTMHIHQDWTAVPHTVATHIYRFLSGQVTAEELFQ